jgi:RNA polymerase sigma-70 factor (ECF subfamily)
MDAIDRASVLARARDGDGEAFQALVKQHGRRVFQLAFRMTGSEHDAEDVVQESFLRAYRQLGRFESRANFGTWLYRIAANCAIDAIRARRTRNGFLAGDPDQTRMDEASAPQPSPERLAASEEVQRQISAALDALTPVERAAFTLRHYEGRSIAEISRLLNLNTSAAKHSIFRAVRKLRVTLKPHRP